MNNVVAGSSMGQAALDKLGVGMLRNVVARVAPSMGRVRFVVVNSLNVNIQYNGMPMGAIRSNSRYVRGDWRDTVDIKHANVPSRNSTVSTSNETKAVREIVKYFVVPEDAAELRRAREQGVSHALARGKTLKADAEQKLLEYVGAYLNKNCGSLGPLLDVLSVPTHEHKLLEEQATGSVEWGAYTARLASATAVAVVGDKYAVAAPDGLRYVEEVPESLRTQVAMLKLAGDRVLVPNRGMLVMSGTLPVYLCVTDQPV